MDPVFRTPVDGRTGRLASLARLRSPLQIQEALRDTDEAQQRSASSRAISIMVWS
jgi:hypothetical protein